MKEPPWRRREWSPWTWYVVCCVLSIGAGLWWDEDGWILAVAAFCAWMMAGLTAIERRLWP